MSVFNTELEQYPWLSKYLSTEELSLLKIDGFLHQFLPLKRMNFLSLVSEFIWSLEDDYAKVLLLDKDGELVTRVGEIPYPAKPVTWWRKDPKPYMVFNPDETIGEAITRTLGKEVSYILDVSLQKLYCL